MMESQTAFEPLLGEDPELLILGSMPGQASLRKFQYYAHPRNVFWRIMGECYGAGFELPYSERVSMLLRQRIAVWDVVQSCVRPGSLDSAIQRSTVVANNFSVFFQSHGSISTVLFNGGAAFTLFKRHIGFELEVGHKINFIQLPSTSPANARLTFEEKMADWCRFLPKGRG